MRRLEGLVIVLLLAAAAGAIAFMVLYVADPDTQLLGLAIGASLALLAAACAIAGERLVSQQKSAEEYPVYDDRDVQREVAERLREPAEGLSRRRLLAGAAGAAGLTLGAAALFPVASLGPRVDARLALTPWRAGRRVVDEDGAPILATDVDRGMMLIGFAEGAVKDDVGASINLIRLAVDELELPPDRRAGAPDGLLAFSRICPHAGCAVSMYRHPLYGPTSPSPALVCPCHYSTFDPRRGGELEFGPAGRALPQLPLRVNDAGQLEAAGNFYDQVGPSYGGITDPPRSEE